jgi:hypothetical protein
MQVNDFFKRNEDIAFRTIEGTTFLVSPSTKKIYPLDEVGKVIWESLGERRDCVSLARIICNEFDVSQETAAQDVSDFMEQLSENGLIEKAG